MEGEDVDLGTCLLIDPGIEGLDGFLAQLSQPEFDETTTGKVEIPTSTTCAGSGNKNDGVGQFIAIIEVLWRPRQVSNLRASG